MCSRSAASRFESVGPADSSAASSSARGARKHRTLGENDRPLDEILKLADVARPAPFDERLQGFGGNRFDAPAHALGMAAEEIADKERNVVAALAQWRNGDGENPQAVIEVAAELSCVDHFGEVAIRGGHEANVYGNRARTADPLELLLLQCAQNLGLEFQGKVAHFIQEECSLMGKLQASDLLCDGPRESPFFVAEQFAFEKPGGNGRAVEFDEGVIAARCSTRGSRARSVLCPFRFLRGSGPWRPLPLRPRLASIRASARNSRRRFRRTGAW